MLKKILSLVPTAIMIFSLIPALTANASSVTADGFLYQMYTDRVSVSGYTGSLTEIEVPERISGLPVTIIDAAAFQNLSSITKITLPKTVNSIGPKAFEGCSSLATINIPDGVTTIFATTFTGCTALSDISLPDSLTSIEAFAFFDTAYYKDKSNWRSGVLYIGNNLIKAVPNVCEGYYVINPRTVCVADEAMLGCSNITKLTLPDTVKNIGYQAFSGTGITYINIPDSIERIGQRAFLGCSALTYVTLPDRAVDIGYGAFLNTACYEASDELYIGKHLIAVKNASGDLTVHDGTLTIAGGAFYGCDKLTLVSLPESLASIGEYAFFGCSALTEVMLPEGLETISMHAFESCNKLTSIVIPKSMGYIAPYAFNLCPDLAIVYYGGSRNDWSRILIDLGNSALSRSTTHLHYNSDKDYIAIVKDLDYFIYSDHIEITDYRGSAKIINIPSEIAGKTVSIIRAGAFADCSSIVEVTIPSSIDIIRQSVFSSCYNLSTVTIPQSVKEIGANAFFDCPSINTVNYEGRKSDWEKITIQDGNDALLNANINYGIEDPQVPTEPDPEIPSGLTYAIYSDHVEISGFTGSEANIVIPEKIADLPVTAIGFGAFYGLSSLKSITLPDSLTVIDTAAFYNCSSLTGVDIPASVTTIGDNAFFGCSSLTEITIPRKLAFLGNGAFLGCSSIEKFKVDAYNYNFKAISGVLFNYSQTELLLFPAGNGLTEYTVENNITSISPYAFANCFSLKNITFGNNLNSIGSGAFINCSSLNHVIMKTSVRNIDVYAFSGCSALSDIYYSGDEAEWAKIAIDNSYGSNDPFIKANIHFNSTRPSIPDGLKYVKYNDHVEISGYLGKAETLEIPSELDGLPVTLIRSRAFYGSSYPSKLIFPDTITSIGESAFSGCSSLNEITILGNDLDLGSFAFSNCSALTKVSMQNVRYIRSYAFYYCTSLSELTIPDSVTRIENNAFSGCSALTELTIPGSVGSVPKDAFSNCTSLESVTILKGVTSVEANAFYSCTSLTTIKLPDSLSYIGSSAFAGCSSLTSFTVTDGVTLIDSDAFSRCNSLTDLYIGSSLSSIGTRAFSDCSSLKTISLSENNEAYKIVDGVLLTKDGTTLAVYPLGSERIGYDIPYGVTTIPQNAFAGCKNLVGVTIPDSVTTIGEFAFRFCGLVSVTVPESVTSLGAGAFIGCENLVRVNILSDFNINNIKVFSNCPAIRCVTLGKAVTLISSSSFFDSSEITDVYYEGDELDWKRINFTTDNDPLKNAAIHFNSTSPEIAVLDPPLLSLEGSSLTVNVSGSNIPSYASLIAVGYGHDNEFIAFSCVIDGSATLPAENVKTVKIFLWESFLNMRALCPSSEAEVN